MTSSDAMRRPPSKNGDLITDKPDFDARQEAIHKLIAQRAYELWENEGRPDGFHLVHWRQAEQELTSCLEPGFLERVDLQSLPQRKFESPANPR